MDTRDKGPSLSSEGIRALLVITTLGWMSLFYLLGQTTGQLAFVFKILFEIAKAAFIGTSAAVIVGRFFIKTTGDGHESRAAIERVYIDKKDAEPAFHAAVGDPLTRSVTIVGISLRDLLLMNGSLSGVWLALRERIKQEAAQGLPMADRLKVRILLLDPLSHEGQFRFQIERPALPQGLRHDVPMAVGEITGLRNELDAAIRDEIVQVRLYDHGSFAFQLLTNDFVIVQQYLYRDQNQPAAIPYVRYGRSSDAYKQLRHSVDIVWEHAHAAEIDPHRVGVAKGAQESRLVGIFRQEDRSLLGERQRDVLRSARAGDIVDIQAVSARFYLQSALQEIQMASGRGVHAAKFRILVLNPIGRAAILRSIADNTPIARISETLRQWTFDKHRTSRLYNDVRDAINTVKRLKSAGCDIDLRLAATELPCSLLLARESTFVEQYLYGRSRAFDRGVVLGGEYAVLEYEHRADEDVTTEQKILRSAFEVIWDSYSTSSDAYLTEEPARELSRFRSEWEALLQQVDLPIAQPALKIKVVILAAGYGMRFLADVGQRGDLRERPELRNPKALLPVVGRPLLEWTIGHLEQLPEIDEIIVVTNELYAGAFEEWRARATLRRSVKLISNGTLTNETRRGALGDLDFVLHREQITGDVLVIGGDNFFGGGFRELITAFQSSRQGHILVHRESPERISGQLGAVEVNQANEVIGFEEKPQRPRSNLASTFCYLFSGEEVRLLKEYVHGSPRRDNGGDFIRHLVNARHGLRAVECVSDWYDIGSYAEYSRLEAAQATL